MTFQFVPNLTVAVARHAVAGVDPQPLPEYESLGAAGFDLRAALSYPMELEPGARALVPTGFRFEIPYGYEMQVRPRSGLAIKYGLTVLNSPGTIDSDYRGEVKVMLINLGRYHVTIEPGQRIAQGVLCPVLRAKFEEVDTLTSTVRGFGGFGSTGEGD